MPTYREFLEAKIDIAPPAALQAQYLLNEINRRFDERNKILEEQNLMLERLLKLLEAKK